MKVRLKRVKALIDLELNYMREIGNVMDFITQLIIQHYSFFSDFNDTHEILLPHFAQNTKPETDWKLMIDDGH
jgi:hypothetical protein